MPTRESPVTQDDDAPSGARAANPDAIRDFLLQLSAIWDYADHYLAARTDELRLRVRGAAFGVAWLAFKFVSAAVISVVSVVYLIRGTAGGLASAFDNRVWLGNLVTGVLGLALLGGAMLIGSWRQSLLRRDRIRRKYERKKSRRKVNNGHDVEKTATVAR